MGELRSTFQNEGTAQDKPDVTTELKVIAEQSRLKGSLLSGSEQAEQLPTAKITMFGNSQEVEYYPAPTNPDRIVVEFIREDGSKGKTNFAKADFEKRRAEA